VKLILLAALWLPLMAQASGDFLCGMHRVQVIEAKDLVIDGHYAGSYQSTAVDRNMAYQHHFRNVERTYILRETQKGRIALKVRYQGGWSSCLPVILGYSGAGSDSNDADHSLPADD